MGFSAVRMRCRWTVPSASISAASTRQRYPKWSVAEPAEADVAIVRFAAPFEPRDHFFLESGMEQGSLEFAPAVVDALRSLAAHTALVVAVTLSRPAMS